MNVNTTKVSKHTAPFGLAVAICSVLNALLVIAKEKSKAVSDEMQRITGHHWTTHVLIVVILFALLGFLLGKTGAKLDARKVTNFILAGVILGVATILGFYLVAD
jgi:phosphatidylglycerophosphate synthase